MQSGGNMRCVCTEWGADKKEQAAARSFMGHLFLVERERLLSGKGRLSETNIASGVEAVAGECTVMAP